VNAIQEESSSAASCHSMLRIFFRSAIQTLSPVVQKGLRLAGSRKLFTRLEAVGTNH